MLQAHNSSLESGQTLIEVLLALSIGVLIIGALSVATFVSIKNSQFSQSQAQATRLAQEGIEIVTALRDRNGEVDSVSPTFTNFSGIWSYGWGRSTSLGFIGYFKLSPTVPKMTRFDNITTASESLLGSFNRYVVIEDFANNSKQVTVKVSWNDSSGYHESNLQTILTNH